MDRWNETDYRWRYLVGEDALQWCQSHNSMAVISTSGKDNMVMESSRSVNSTNEMIVSECLIDVCITWKVSVSLEYVEESEGDDINTDVDVIQLNLEGVTSIAVVAENE